MSNLVDESGQPLVIAEPVELKPWELSIYAKDWRPDMSLSYPMMDLEVVSLVNLFTSQYVNENGKVDDAEALEALVEKVFEEYGSRMTDYHKMYLRMAIHQTIFQVGIQYLIAAKRRESSVTEDVRRRMAKELIDQIDRPNRKRDRKRRNNGN